MPIKFSNFYAIQSSYVSLLIQRRDSSWPGRRAWVAAWTLLGTCAWEGPRHVMVDLGGSFSSLFPPNFEQRVPSHPPQFRFWFILPPHRRRKPRETILLEAPSHPPSPSSTPPREESREEAPHRTKKPEKEKFCNTACVERFLKAKGDSVKKARKQLRACLSWRESIGTEHLIADEFSTEISDGVAYIAGHDDESRPVMVFRIKQDYQKFHSKTIYSVVRFHT